MKRLKLIGTGNGGMSGGKHFWGIWGTENRLSFSFFSFLFFFFFFFLHRIECGILLSQAQIEPVLPAVEAQSLNHWTTREVQCQLL